MNKDQSGHPKPQDEKSDRNEDSFSDQRDPDTGAGAGGQPRHWQGKDSGEQGSQHEAPDFDRRNSGRGQQAGLAGQYGREHEDRRNQETKSDADYDRDSDFGRGDERMRDEGGSERGYPGVHTTSEGGEIHSRSADPGQSSYGGFSNEDPRLQRQQDNSDPVQEQSPAEKKNAKNSDSK